MFCSLQFFRATSCGYHDDCIALSFKELVDTGRAERWSVIHDFVLTPILRCAPPNSRYRVVEGSSPAPPTFVTVKGRDTFDVVAAFFSVHTPSSCPCCAIFMLRNCRFCSR